ncbi:MAG: hypothetical protein AAF821_16195 [Cyanobacteria bacterium P01_D01_bin.156]
MSSSLPPQHILRQLDLQSDKSYLTTEELTNLGRYVSGLSERVRIYRQLREQEVDLMQNVVDGLPADLKESTFSLDQSIRQAILILRYAALGMLVNDANLGKRRLEGWLPTMVEVYQTQSIDVLLHRALNQQLPTLLTASQVALLQPSLESAQQLLF